MDSRFRGNDVIRARHATLTTTVISDMAVIPPFGSPLPRGGAGSAEAGIHHLIQGVMNPETWVHQYRPRTAASTQASMEAMTGSYPYPWMMLTSLAEFVSRRRQPLASPSSRARIW